MIQIVRVAVASLCVASLVSLASGCAGNDESASATGSAAVTSSSVSVGVVIPGSDGGRIFTNQQDMLDTFRAMAVNNGTLPSTEASTYDPTAARVTPDQTELSDSFNSFTGPDGHRYEWVYLPTRSAWVFADRKENTGTVSLLEPYINDVIYGNDTSGDAYAYLAPIEAWYDAQMSK